MVSERKREGFDFIFLLPKAHIQRSHVSSQFTVIPNYCPNPSNLELKALKLIWKEIKIKKGVLLIIFFKGKLIWN